MKRFYSKVAAEPREGGWQVTLDGRGIKTVGRRAQIVPTAALAEALAQEWERQGERIDPGDFPYRDMADYAIDVVAGDRQAVAHKLVAYADTDTLLYRADPDEPLYARQCELWEPILTAFEAREGITLRRISGIVHAPQDEAALAMLRERVAALDPFTLAALEAMTSLAASLCTGLSALEPEADGRALWQAASLEEEWQAQLWGRDAEAEARRERREADFLRGAEFARLAQA